MGVAIGDVMRSLVVDILDDLDAILEAICAEQGRGKSDLAADILGRHLRAERLRRAMRDPEVTKLCAELSDESRDLAEEGIADYASMLAEADRW